MKYRVYDIDWDVDFQEDLENLPDSCVVEVEDDECIADALSDEYGFCVRSFGVRLDEVD